MLALLGLLACHQDPTTPVGDDDDSTPTDVGPTDTGGTETTPTGDSGDPPLPPLPRLIVDEIQAGNQSTVQPAGTTATPDWVELVNDDVAPIALSRVQLRNDASDIWIGTEADGELLPGERRLIWFGEAAGDGGTFTGFPLDRDGDELVVIVDDRLLERIEIPALDSDLSWARFPGLTGELQATALPTPGEPNGEAPSASLNPADETFFVTGDVHRVDFLLSSSAMTEIDGFLRPEVHAAMAVDGIRYADVGLKLKGSASYQTMRGKPAFVVDLNQWVPGTRFRGLKKFKLHNGNVYDPTRVHDHLTYKLAREAGLMAPRVGWAQVFVNGEDYGIYMIIEAHDDQFIKYHHPTQEQTGVVLEPNESTAGWGDFGRGNVLDWDMEQGPLPPDPLSLQSLEMVDEIVRRRPTDENIEELWQYADKELLFSYMAWESVAMHTDGYKVTNNWRVYVDGDDHLVSLLPSGAEMTWMTPVQPWWFLGKLASFCLNNRGCKHDYSARLIEVADLADSLDLVDDFVARSTELDPYIQSDPRYMATGAVERERESTVDRLRDNPTQARNAAWGAFPDLRP
ncbi:MAG: CotH kinase family protein [Myxococcales bacterium]|nr:CotH kinase family protein [Myxococcales bacterium]